jgi:arylsulfatase A-like enzyme
VNVALRRGDWNIVAQREPGVTEPPMRLFDLGEDPAESRDLARERPETLRSLEEELRAINRQVSKPAWGPARVRGEPAL